MKIWSHAGIDVMTITLQGGYIVGYYAMKFSATANKQVVLINFLELSRPEIVQT